MPRFLLVAGDEIQVPGDGVCACQGFIGEGKIKSTDTVCLADLQATTSVMKSRLGAAHGCIDTRDLPLAPNAMHGGTNLSPEQSGSVRRIDHHVVFITTAILLFQQSPGVVEQLFRRLPTSLRI